MSTTKMSIEDFGRYLRNMADFYDIKSRIAGTWRARTLYRAKNEALADAYSTFKNHVAEEARK